MNPETNHSIEAPVIRPALLTVKQAAEYLQISTRQVYLMVASNLIPFRRIPSGGKGIRAQVRFDLAELEKWTKPEGGE